MYVIQLWLAVVEVLAQVDVLICNFSKVCISRLADAQMQTGQSAADYGTHSCWKQLCGIRPECALGCALCAACRQAQGLHWSGKLDKAHNTILQNRSQLVGCQPAIKTFVMGKRARPSLRIARISRSGNMSVLNTFIRE